MPKPDLEHALPGLVRRCQAGDQAAWSRLVEEFRSLVYGAARNAGLGEEDRAEVFQATFLALYRSIDRIENPAALPGWLATTASRLAIRLSANTRARETSDIEPLAELLASEERETDELAALALQAETLRHALDSIGGKCAPLLRMLYLGEGASYEDISAELGMAIGSIGPTRARCLERLRKKLDESGFFDDNVYQARDAEPPIGQEL